MSNDDQRGDAIRNGDDADAEAGSTADLSPVGVDGANAPAAPTLGKPRQTPQESVARRLLAPAAFAAALIMVGSVIFSGVNGLLRNNGLQDRIGATQAEIDQLQLQAEQLAALVAWLDSDAYIERSARESLGMVRPGEEAFAIHAPQREALEFTRWPWWSNLLPDTTADVP